MTTHSNPQQPVAPAAERALHMSLTENPLRQLDVQLYKVSDVMRTLSMSRTVVFELLRSGRLRSVKQGRIRLIPASAIREYVALLEKEAEAA